MSTQEIDVDNLLRQLRNSRLTYADQEFIREILEGKQKLVFGDPEQLKIIHKLTAMVKVCDELAGNKEEAMKVLQIRINHNDQEVNNLENEIEELEQENTKIRDILQQLKK